MKRNVSILILVLLLSGFFLISYIFKDSDSEDAEKLLISDKFPKLDDNNVFNIINNNEVLDFLSNGSGLLIIGTYQSIWMEEYLLLYNEIANDLQIDNINFFDIYPSRIAMNSTYNDIIDILEKYTYQSDENINILVTPISFYLEDGKVMFMDNETALMNSGIIPDEYWDEASKEEFKNKIINNIINIERN